MGVKSDKEKTKQDRYSIYAIEKAFDVIEKLSEHHSLSLIDLTELVNQPKSSLYRIILTLEKLGYVTRNDEDGKYCLGYKHLLITKNLLEKNTIRSSALAEMNGLVTKYRDTVNLGILSSGDVMYLEIIEGTNALRMTDTVGSRAPFYATAMGKVISAQMHVNDVEKLLEERQLKPITANTITKRDDFMAELVKIKAQGYAIDDQEIVEGARCLAAPIFEMFGKVVAAISLSGAIHRFSDEEVPEIAKDLITAANNISRKLGYDHSLNAK